MIKNVESIDDLRGLARLRAIPLEKKSVPSTAIGQSLEQGWEIEKKGKTSTRIRRQKSESQWYVDRVWTLLYKMGFDHLSNQDGGSLSSGQKETSTEPEGLGIVALNNEVALFVKCISASKYGSLSDLQNVMQELVKSRERLARVLNAQFPLSHRRQIIFCIFLSNVALDEEDKQKAKDLHISLFDEKDLEYYQSLVSQVGPAAKYQFFADMIPGKSIPGLAVRVPAVRTRMGGFHCYSFSISPEYLLKMAYVSHRSKGKASDVDTYQRMLNKGRLNKIKQYISDDGIFPTNIVLNLDKKRLNFERAKQQSDVMDAQDVGVLGWLDIKAAYKSAWIIDGQHRLFAYSGHPKASKGLLSVLAFEGLAPSKQAELFIDINAKQKSVKQSLLQELYSELHWDADEPEVRVQAIVSKAIQQLGAEQDSPLFDRIQTADATKDNTRCISLTSVFSAIEKTEFLLRPDKGGVVQFGPLWAEDNQKTLARTVYVIKKWFQIVTSHVPDWWVKGSGDGGGLSMNDGVTTCINVLRSVLLHLDPDQTRLVKLKERELVAELKPFGDKLGEYLASLSDQERKRFRELRGIQGQTRRTRRCQEAINKEIPEFNPSGLQEFLELEKAQTNEKAKQIIDRMEIALQTSVVEELKANFGPEESGWWFLGVPQQVRTKVLTRYDEDTGKRGGREYYFDLIDYKSIADKNWTIFEKILGFGKSGGKDKRLQWFQLLNEKRRIVAHASSAVKLTLSELEELEQLEAWLQGQIAGRDGESAVSTPDGGTNDEGS